MKPPRVTEAEWQVLEALWDGHPATANDLVERLARATDWHPRTVKTLLGRLVKKGAVRYRPDGKRYLYSPAVERAACVREESRSFLERVFGGAAAPALVHLVEDADLSDEEIRRLQNLLERKLGRGDDESGDDET